MTIVGGSHKRGKSGTILLGTPEYRASIHLADRQRLLQRCLLGRADGFQLVEVDQEIVRQSHLLIKLVRQIQMVEVILTQMLRQQTTHEGGLSATLTSDERRHTLITMKHVHLQPVGHSRSQPDGEIVQLLGGDAWNTGKNLGYMVLSVPCRQIVQKILYRIILRHFLRFHILLNLRLRVPLFQHLFALGTNHDAFKGRLRQRTIITLRIATWLCRELYLSVEDVSSETVVAHEEQLDYKRSHLGDSWSLYRQKITLLHSL